VALEVEFYVAGGVGGGGECSEVVGERVAKRPGRGRNSRARRVR
jgi:hypothetical protein